MKNYTYNGQQASFAIRTAAGVLTLTRGVTANVSKELHQAAKKHPVVQALMKTGELSVTGEFAPEQPVTQPNPPKDQTETDPAIHSLNGATVVDAPVTTQLASASAAPEIGEAPAAPAADTNSQPAADQASSSTADPPIPAPAADSAPEAGINAESAPKPPTIPQLKKQLDEAGIQYEANAKRDELVALLPK